MTRLADGPYPSVAVPFRLGGIANAAASPDLAEAQRRSPHARAKGFGGGKPGGDTAVAMTAREPAIDREFRFTLPSRWKASAGHQPADQATAQRRLLLQMVRCDSFREKDQVARCRPY